MKTNLRHTIVAILTTAAGILLALTFQPATLPNYGGPRLAFQKLTRPAKNKSERQSANLITNLVSSANAPTFGHPIIAGIGGTGFEGS